MIKGVLGQPNFSPQTNTTQKTQTFCSFFPEISNLFHSSNLTQLDMFVLTLTDDKLLKFVLIWGESCVVFVWGEKLGCPRTPFIILLPSLNLIRIMTEKFCCLLSFLV